MEKKYTLNNYPCSSYLINDIEYFKYRNLLYCYMNTIPQPNELLKISKENIYKVGGRGRYSITYINGIGLSEWINHSLRFTPHEKREYIKELQEKNIVDKSIIPYSSKKEINFMSELIDFFKQINKNTKIEFQKQIDNYFVDCLINNKNIVEYDENKHISYDKDIEEKRENYLKNLGYNLIRINDKQTIGESLGIILNSLE